MIPATWGFTSGAIYSAVSDRPTLARDAAHLLWDTFPGTAHCLDRNCQSRQSVCSRLERTWQSTRTSPAIFICHQRPGTGTENCQFSDFGFAVILSACFLSRVQSALVLLPSDAASPLRPPARIALPTTIRATGSAPWLRSINW